MVELNWGTRIRNIYHLDHIKEANMMKERIKRFLITRSLRKKGRMDAVIYYMAKYNSGLGEAAMYVDSLIREGVMHKHNSKIKKAAADKQTA